jgi:transposase
MFFAMYDPKTDPTTARMIQMASEGHTSRHIAAEMGLSFSNVRTRLTRLRRRGLCPPINVARGAFRNVQAASDRADYLKLKKGSIGLLLFTLGEELGNKFLKEIPPGMAIAEYAAAIIKDQMLD